MGLDDRRRHARTILVLANGNLNGRVMRLVADGVHRTLGGRARLITTTRLSPLVVWPEERDRPHRVEPEPVEWAEAERLVTTASVVVVPPTWNDSARHLIGLARRAGTPVVYVVPDIDYGVGKLVVLDPSHLPDWICIADPVTRHLLLRNGVPASILRNTGSPYFDEILVEPPLPPPPSSALRVGILASADGLREPQTGETGASPDGVLAAVTHVLGAFPGARITVRLHPRQRPGHVSTAFPLPEGASFDPVDPVPTLRDFFAAHHLIVGSFSLGLMVARLFGRPAISFQPPMSDEGLRRQVFPAWDVPVVTDEAALARCVVERLQSPGDRINLESRLYQCGGSVDAILQVILEAESQPHEAPALGSAPSAR